MFKRLVMALVFLLGFLAMVIVQPVWWTYFSLFVLMTAKSLFVAVVIVVLVMLGIHAVRKL